MHYTIPLMYQIFYVIIPAISVIGNVFIIYVTVQSKNLRSTCNIFIALISVGDVLHSLSHFVMVMSYNISTDREIRQDLCVYLQSLPLFGCFFSSLMLLNVALDRLLSLQKIYIIIDNMYKKLYMTVEIMLALVYALSMVSWIFANRTSNEMVICDVTAPVNGLVYDVFLNSIMLFNVLIIACYTLLICFIKNVNMGNINTKQIYRSLIIISLTVVFGWFSTMLIVTIAHLLHMDVERIYVNLLAGLFVNFACATNFFVYYAVSKQYRQLFDEHLFIGLAKKMFGTNGNAVTVRPIVTEQQKMRSQRNGQY